jgi:hypothetical protein
LVKITMLHVLGFVEDELLTMLRAASFVKDELLS